MKAQRHKYRHTHRERHRETPLSHFKALPQPAFKGQLSFKKSLLAIGRTTGRGSAWSPVERSSTAWECLFQGDPGVCTPRDAHMESSSHHRGTTENCLARGTYRAEVSACMSLWTSSDFLLADTLGRWVRKGLAVSEKKGRWRWHPLPRD